MTFVHSTGDRWALICADVEAGLAMLPEMHFDAVLCDPPYGLDFMGKHWDYGAPSIAQWSAVLRVLKPGAPILSFGGTRTYHRLVCALEDAGAEIRDQIVWIYGSGFPKSQDASKAIDKAIGAERPVVGTRVLTGSAALSTAEKGGTYASNTDARGVPAKTIDVTGPATELARTWEGYGTALKPAIEPIVLARKPLDGTLAANITAHGCGPLAIDACRISTDHEKSAPHDLGRWPANAILDEVAGEMLDAQSGDRPGMSSGGKHRVDAAPGTFGAIDGNASHLRGDNGGASRFFYCAKASRSEREAGLEGFPVLSGGALTDRKDGSAGLDNPRAGAGRRGGRRNPHPTVKPQELLRYLATLVRPASGGRILVPWAGVGSEMIGALQAGFVEVVGIERESLRALFPEHRQPYCEVAEARIRHWTSRA